MWSDSLYMSLCGVILFVGWLVLFGRANNNHPSPLSSYPPLLFGLYSSFSHRDKDGYDFWTISEASLTPIYTIAFISRSIFWHLVPHINYYLFKQNQALSISYYSLISRPLHMQIISAVPNTNSSSLTHNENIGSKQNEFLNAGIMQGVPKRNTNTWMGLGFLQFTMQVSINIRTASINTLNIMKHTC
jgi:hypothetical protein